MAGRKGTWLLLCAAALLLLHAEPSLGKEVDAKEKRAAKKLQNYEIKQNLKKERKKKWREDKEKGRKENMAALKKQKSGEKRQKKKTAMDPKLKEAAEEKIAYLRRRIEGSYSKIISLVPDSYREYVNDGPRLHWSLVVFTARGSRYRCSICHVVHPHVVRLAQSMNYTLNQPTFVMEVDVQRNQEIFNEIELSHAPVFLMIPPTTSTRKPKIKTLYKKLPDKYRLNAHNNIGGEDLKKFLARHTKQEVELIEVIDYNVLVGWACLVGMIVAGLYYRGDQLHKIRQFTLPYFGICIITFIWLAGGGMYNIIRGTAFSGNGVGFSSFFHPSNGNQYMAGGLIVGCLNFGVGAMIILLNTWALKDHEELKLAKKKSTREPKTPLQHLKELKPSPGLCLIGATVLWYNLIMIYTMKNPSYRLGFVQA
eukprot:CAMPEP_0114516842 /NCGR_PEP_ID=MMETSP0109-20121206/17555_1 /TAXON_ID=29199 /ORGANISM="Chlorarachnion reptans, Strain CCCM449" /LENGTH=423 /DNA_ID=CAMNT_0001697281 /DNA_START=121 /DNA_END=1392 /DNA_ORIENTATION=-